MVSLLSVAFTGALALADPAGAASRSIPAPSHALLTAPERRVRAADTRVQAILQDGLRRSPTFAALLAALNRSDVIVYVERLMTLPKDTIGRLTIVPGAHKQRYLRIHMRADLSRNEAIALIAHEMQHALEVADATDVYDADGMITLYRRIGHSSGGDHVFDTTAAQDTGRQVRRELAG
jgi:hypothetical protein